jgi:integrase
VKTTRTAARVDLQSAGAGRDGKLARTKTARSVRTIRMSDELRLMLRKAYMASEHKQPDAFVFSCESGTAPIYSNARKALAGAIKEAGIEYDKTSHRASFHGFRHGAVSALIRNGADPVRVARFVGDRVETVLSVYAGEWEGARDDNLGDVLSAALSIA